MPDLLFPPSIDEQILCVERELGFRERLYVRSVASGKMTQKLADRELGAMRAVLDTLRQVRAGMVPPAKRED